MASVLNSGLIMALLEQLDREYSFTLEDYLGTSQDVLLLAVGSGVSPLAW